MDDEAADIHERDTIARESRTNRKFRFKRSKDAVGTENNEDERRGEQDRHRQHRHHHRRKRRKVTADEDGIPINNVSNMPQDQAFQESLFDALADDEGAAFWESVYGQPIHSFPNTFVDPDTGNSTTMNDEEYAQFVRQKMWEKSAEGIEAARQRRNRERKQEDEEKARQARGTNERSFRNRNRNRNRSNDNDETAYNNYHFDFELESSLRRGERRKERRYWQTLWKDYTTGWEKLYGIFERRRGTAVDSTEQVSLRDAIVWPVESGQLSDVNGPNVHRFMEGVVAALNESDPAIGRKSLFKAERVRWHPDKIQQRYGFMSIDKPTMEGVTAVFQVLDQMLTKLREAG